MTETMTETETVTETVTETERKEREIRERRYIILYQYQVPHLVFGIPSNEYPTYQTHTAPETRIHVHIKQHANKCVQVNKTCE